MWGTALTLMRELFANRFLWGTLFGIGLGFLILWRMRIRNSREVRMLTDRIKNITRGNASEISLPNINQSDLATLAHEVNRLAALSNVQTKKTQKASNEIVRVLENMAEGVIAVDGNEKVLMINSATKKIFGIAETNVLNRTLMEIVRNTEIVESVSQVLGEEKEIEHEVKLSYPRASILKLRAKGVRSERRNELSGVILLHDVTEIRRLENLRQEFVANVSHELKTPLTSIKGFIETLSEGGLNDVGQSKIFLGMMNEDADRLERLMDDLLELSKLDSKEIPLKREAVQLKEEIEKTILMFRSQIEKKKIKIRNELSNSNLEVWADRHQLRQVLTNLIDNAIKFNREEGSITVRADLTREGQIQLSVQDSGIGIPAKDIPRIFERFFRVDKARSRELGGTGLGLSIVKHVAEIHGGQVSCSSELGKSSTFFITLPQYQ